MSGLLVALDIEGLDAVRGRIEGLTRYELADLAFDLGALLESSTKERIATDKKSPDGQSWAPWSEAYGATRGGHHSLLVSDGSLRDSVQSFSSGREVRVGSNLVYAAIHHFGGEEVDMNIPARPWLGLSRADEEDIRDLVVGDMREVLQ